MHAETVTIGHQAWMTRNLDVSSFRNGDVIPQCRTDKEWIIASRSRSPAWCYYNNDEDTGRYFGKLYNFYAVRDPRGLAPIGFHVPTKNEWATLRSLGTNALKSSYEWASWDVQEQIKCDNCEGWNEEYRSKVPCHKCKDTRWVSGALLSYDGCGSDSSGFTALPGGKRNEDGEFLNLGREGVWWTTDVESGIAELSGCAYAPNICSNDSISFIGMSEWGCGFSVRCIEDVKPAIEDVKSDIEKKESFWRKLFGQLFQD